MAQQFKAGDVIMSPIKRTAMWKVMGYEGDQVRLIRTNKIGEPHGLLRDLTGFLRPAAEIANFEVIAHAGAATTKAAAKPAAAKTATKAAAKAPTKAAAKKVTAVHRPLRPQRQHPQAAPATKPQAVKPVASKLVTPKAPTTVRAHGGGQRGDFDVFLRAMETFHRNEANGYQQFRRELAASGRK